MKILSYFFMLVLISGCDLFSTRIPESPDNNRIKFQPPTSAQIVIDNFILSITNKNVENFSQCLSDSNSGNYKFVFLPSTEASINYQNLFNDWEKSDEVKVMNSIFANLDDKSPKLSFSNTGFEQLTPDSAIFISAYTLIVPHSLDNIPKEFSGLLQFTIAHNNSQLWSIIRWIDYSNNDSLHNSWSILKAFFYN